MQPKLHLTFLFFCITLLFSCSSDPCDDTPCVNGSCNEGICECAEGWKGPSCAEIDYNFIGEYASTLFSVVDCPNPNSNTTLTTNSDNEACVVQGNVTSCLKVILRFDDDGTYFLNIIAIEINGPIRRGDPTVIRGNYTVDDNIATLCDASECITMTMDMTQQIITWDQSLSTSANCGIRWELTRE